MGRLPTKLGTARPYIGILRAGRYCREGYIRAWTFDLVRYDVRLVHRTAARADWAELALFDLEGQHVEQAGDAIVERLEQGLLLQRRNVEVKAQEIDQVGVAQPLLFDQPAPGRVG